MDAFTGQIVLFAGTYAPKGWALCFGQTMQVQSYQVLFSILSNTYGGDGVKTFCLPDLRGRAPIGTGQLPGLPNYASGDQGGQMSATLTTNNLPAHSHPLNVSTASATQPNPDNAYLSVTADGGGGGTPPLVYGLAGGAVASPQAIGSVGANLPVPTMSPYIAMNYIICLNGNFPIRQN